MKRIKIISIMLTFVLLCFTLSSCNAPEKPQRIAYPETFDYETYGDDDLVFGAINDDIRYYYKKIHQYIPLTSFITDDVINKTCTLSVYMYEEYDAVLKTKNFRLPNFCTSSDDGYETAFDNYSVSFNWWDASSPHFSRLVNNKEDFNYVKNVLDSLIPYYGDTDNLFQDSGFDIVISNGEKTKNYEIFYNGFVRYYDVSYTDDGEKEESDEKWYELQDIVDYYAIKTVAMKYLYPYYNTMTNQGNLGNYFFALNSYDWEEGYKENYQLCMRTVDGAHKDFNYEEARALLIDMFTKNGRLKYERGSYNIPCDLDFYLNSIQFLNEQGAIMLSEHYGDDEGFAYYITADGRLLYIRPYFVFGYADNFPFLYGKSLSVSIEVSEPIFDYDALLELISG